MARKKEKIEETEVKEPERPVIDVKVSDEDKLSFFKAFLSDQPFELTETMMEGKISLKFRSLTTDENMHIFDQLRKEQVAGLLTNDANYLTQLTCYRLALSLQKINDDLFSDITLENGVTPANAEIDGSYVAKRAAKVKTWPVFKLTAFAEAFKSFEDKLIYLTKEVQTENFWPADR